MFWRISQFPEFDCLEPDERRAALRDVSVTSYLSLVGRAFIAAWFIAIPATLVAAKGGWLGSDQITIAVGGLSLTLAVGLFAYQVMLRRIRHNLRLEVAKAFIGGDAPFCFRCGYDLRGTGAMQTAMDRAPRVCPECGARDRAAHRPASLPREVGRFVAGVFSYFRA